jgi:hypothetical protein
MSIGKERAKYEKPPRSLLACLIAGMLPKTTSSNKGNPSPIPMPIGVRQASLLSLSRSLPKAARGVFILELFILVIPLILRGYAGRSD